jgi:hypothetical protein
MASAEQSEPPYGSTERELAFKLLAAHAVCDDLFPEFLNRLRYSPRDAAAELHLSLTDDDVRYIQEKVQWDGGETGVRLEDSLAAIRPLLVLEAVTNSW